MKTYQDLEKLIARVEKATGLNYRYNENAGDIEFENEEEIIAFYDYPKENEDGSEYDGSDYDKICSEIEEYFKELI